MSLRSANLLQPKVEAGAFFRSLVFFGQPPKCDVAHTSLPLAPPKSDMATSIWWPGGDTWHRNQNQLGLHISSGWFLR